MLGHSNVNISDFNSFWVFFGTPCRLYYKIDDFLQILLSLCFETHLMKFYGNETHNAKILSIYLSNFNEKEQNYSSIKVHLKWSLGEFKRFIA